MTGDRKSHPFTGIVNLSDLTLTEPPGENPKPGTIWQRGKGEVEGIKISRDCVDSLQWRLERDRCALAHDAECGGATRCR